jgi:hypothetical protein
LKFGFAAVFVESGFELEQSRHQGFGDVFAAEFAKSAEGVGALGGGFGGFGGETQGCDCHGLCGDNGTNFIISSRWGCGRSGNFARG